MGELSVQSRVSVSQRSLLRPQDERTDEANSLLGRVNLGDLSLPDLDLALQVTRKEASRLDDGASSEGADGDGRKEGREEEVVARGDDDLYVVVQFGQTAR